MGLQGCALGLIARHVPLIAHFSHCLMTQTPVFQLMCRYLPWTLELLEQPYCPKNLYSDLYCRLTALSPLDSQPCIMGLGYSEPG